MSLNSSKLTCWSPLISASWKCQGEFVRGSWFNTCTQININNCKQQKQLQITCTISPSSSSVSSTPRRVRTNLISEVDTIPFPSCIHGDFHWFQNWFIPVSIFPSLLPYFDVLLLSFTLSKTLKACLRSSGVSFSCSLWRRYQYYSHVTLRAVLVEVSFTPPHPSPWSSNQQIRQSPQSQNHRHRRPSGKVGDDCSGGSCWSWSWNKLTSIISSSSSCVGLLPGTETIATTNPDSILSSRCSYEFKDFKNSRSSYEFKDFKILDYEFKDT